MSMEISGGYGRAAVDYAEQRKAGIGPKEAEEEKEEVKEAKEVQKAEQSQKAAEGRRTSSQLFDLQDEYISSEKSEKRPTGLYRLGQDENGNRKIYFEDPNGREPKTDGENPEKPVEVCVGNTDRVDGEIRKLKEKRQQLEQQMQSASGDEKKVRELERKMAQVEQELNLKDNDTYRRQHTVFT